MRSAPTGFGIGRFHCFEAEIHEAGTEALMDLPIDITYAKRRSTQRAQDLPDIHSLHCARFAITCGIEIIIVARVCRAKRTIEAAHVIKGGKFQLLAQHLQQLRLKILGLVPADERRVGCSSSPARRDVRPRRRTVASY